MAKRNRLWWPRIAASPHKLSMQGLSAAFSTVARQGKRFLKTSRFVDSIQNGGACYSPLSMALTRRQIPSFLLSLSKPNDDASWYPLCTPVAGAGKVIFMKGDVGKPELCIFYTKFIPHPKASQG